MRRIQLLRHKYLRFFLYGVVIVLINIAGSTFFYRFDLTGTNMYSLSNASRNTVSSLSEPLTIKVFFTDNLPAPYNHVRRYLNDLLKEYALSANEHFNYQFYTVSPESADETPEQKRNREMAQDYGIPTVQIQHIEKDEVKFKNGYMGLVLIHGDMIERIPTISSTDRLEYRLTTAIRRLSNKTSAFLAVEKPITVKLIMSPSLCEVASYMGLKEEDFRTLPERIKAIVDDLNAKMYGKLTYERVAPTAADEEDILKKYRVMRLNWPDLDGDGAIQAGSGLIGLVMEYRDQSVESSLINVMRFPIVGLSYELFPPEAIEEMIDNNLEVLVDINDTLNYLTDHGTRTVPGMTPKAPEKNQNQGQLQIFRALVGHGYSLRGVTTETGLEEQGGQCLVVAGPQEHFADDELYQIDQWLMQGKNLAIFLDTYAERTMPGGMGQPQGTFFEKIDTGLEKMLEHYGIAVRQSYVMDEKCYRQKMPASMGGGEQPLYFAPIIQEKNINGDLPLMRNIRGLITMKVSPVETIPERLEEQGLTATQVFSSSDRSWEKDDCHVLDPRTITPPSEEKMGRIPLAYIVEGSFRSYFAGKGIPVKKEDNNGEKGTAPSVEKTRVTAEGDFVEKGKPAKIFVMASADMLSDALLDEKGNSTNAMFVMNVIDHLNGKDDIIDMRTKVQRFNPLRDTTDMTKTSMKSFNIAGLPVLVVVIGILVWVRRAARRRRIQRLFAGKQES